LRNLKAEKRKDSTPVVEKTAYILAVVFSNPPLAYPLPLTDLFTFNSLFLLLPDFLSGNIPVSFP